MIEQRSIPAPDVTDKPPKRERMLYSQTNILFEGKPHLVPKLTQAVVDTRGPLRGHIFATTRDASSVDDVSQETYMRLMRVMSRDDNPLDIDKMVPNGDKREQKHHLILYLCRVASNIIIDKGRAKKSRVEEAELKVNRNDEPEGGMSVHHKVPSPETVVIPRILLQEAFDELQEPHRETAILGLIEELPLEEIVTVLKVPKGTIKSRLFYARKMLQDSLRSKGISSGYGEE